MKTQLRCIAAIAALGASQAAAELIFEFDVLAAEFDLISEIQDIAPNPSNYTGDAYGVIAMTLSSLPSDIKNVLQSSLKEVCPLVSLQGALHNQHYFRSNHALGSLDWGVQVSGDSPNLISSLVLIGVPGGPPGILPLFPDNPMDNLIPNSQMNCMSEADREVAQQEIIDACKELPDRCRFIQE